MPGSGRTVYIAGAGIAGMTLALALAKFGAHVVLIEREKAIQELGAGVQISPNARHVLDRLGVEKAIAERSFEPPGLDLYAGGGERRLVTLTLGQAARARYGAPYAVMHRQDLADLLFRACKRFANIEIMFGVRSFDLEAHANGVSVLADEADGKLRNARAFAFVGADGVHSRTRTALLGGPAAMPTGTIAWRALLEMDALEAILPLDRVSLLFGPGHHAVVYPLPHRNRVNLALFVRETPKAREEPPREPRFHWAARPAKRLGAIIEKARGSWGRWPLHIVSLPRWHNGAVGLIGDAAHAMHPFQAQGAAMAIEDAALLAPLLMTEPDAATAFARFEAMRRRRVERVARVSRRNGIIYGLEWPMTLARDLAILAGGRSAHFRRLDWLYGYDAAPEVETGAIRAPS